MTRREKAVQFFEQGYNCAQSVALAFEDAVGLDRETLARAACSFGGGVARLRETCGAVSGMALVLGLLYGYATPETGAVKAQHYALVQKAALLFEQRRGSLVCRDLLGLSVRHDAPEPTPRTADFYTSRPCAGCIGDAAEILEEILSDKASGDDHLYEK